MNARKSVVVHLLIIIIVICIGVIVHGATLPVIDNITVDIKNDNSFSEEERINEEKAKELNNYIEEDFKGIVVWGDSLTKRGVADAIEKAICKRITDPVNSSLNLEYLNEIQIPVINMGVGSENSAMIAARSGAIPYILLNDINVPSDSLDIDIEIGLADGTRPQIKFGRQGTGIESVFIDGIEGIIETDYNNHYTFRRKDNGSSKTIVAGTQIYSIGSQTYRHYVPVIYIGTNGGYDNNPEILIQQQQEMIKYIDAIDDLYIIVGIHTGDKESRSNLEEEMRNAWGTHYINLREELVNYDYEAYGLCLSEDDQISISKGMCPNVILESDGLHFTSTGNQIVADIITRKMTELDFFVKIQDIAERSFTNNNGEVDESITD